jgi:hypothetical protein
MQLNRRSPVDGARTRERRFADCTAILCSSTPVGVRKTVAVRAATSQLDPTAHHIVYVATPTVGSRGLYLTIVHALAAMPRGQKGRPDRADANVLGRRAA